MLKKRWFQTLITLILIFVLIYMIAATDFIFIPLFKYIGAVAFPFIGAGLLFYLTRPVMHFLEKHKVHRLLSILVVFILLILAGYVVITYIAPIAQRQFTNLINNIPKMVAAVQDLVTYWQVNQDHIPQEVNNMINEFTSNLQTYAESAVSLIFDFISQFISFIFALALVPFFLFFMLKDGDKFAPFVTQVFGKKKAKNLRALLAKIDHTLEAYIQGQLLVSVVLGVFLFIGYLIIGLDYALTLALFGMLLCVIPFLGPFLAVIPAAIVGVFQDPMMPVWVSIVMLIANQVEGNLISPNIMGRALRLHPLTVITVILAAGSIAGFIGILFAVPFYAVAKAIIVHCYETYVDSKQEKSDALI